MNKECGLVHLCMWKNFSMELQWCKKLRWMLNIQIIYIFIDSNATLNLSQFKFWKFIQLFIVHWYTCSVPYLIFSYFSSILLSLSIFLYNYLILLSLEWDGYPNDISTPGVIRHVIMLYKHSLFPYYKLTLEI